MTLKGQNWLITVKCDEAFKQVNTAINQPLASAFRRILWFFVTFTYLS
jgi:hypothetical protein